MERHWRPKSLQEQEIQNRKLLQNQTWPWNLWSSWHSSVVEQPLKTTSKERTRLTNTVQFLRFSNKQTISSKSPLQAHYDPKSCRGSQNYRCSPGLASPWIIHRHQWHPNHRPISRHQLISWVQPVVVARTFHKFPKRKVSKLSNTGTCEGLNSSLSNILRQRYKPQRIKSLTTSSTCNEATFRLVCLKV